MMKSASIVLSMLMVLLTAQPLLHEIYHQKTDEAACSCSIAAQDQDQDQDHSCCCDTGCDTEDSDHHQCNHDCHCSQKTAPVYTSFETSISKYYANEIEINASFIDTYTFFLPDIIWHPPISL